MTAVEYSSNVRFEANGRPLASEWDGVTHVRYVEDPIREQVRWGNNSDPADALLEVGEVYELERVVVHTWHTKIFLSGIDCGRGFNSVSFEAVS